MAPPAVIGIGASAGGVEALSALVRSLPADIPAALFVVLHISPAGTSALPEILSRAGRLPAVAAEDGMEARAGYIYVAPPDRHLLLVDGVVRLWAGPRENGHRPAVDPTFRSLAACGARATAVVLSGTRDDGTAGAARVRAAGGRVMVQSPEEAAYDGMVTSVIVNVGADSVLPVAEIATHLDHLARAAADMPEPQSDEPAPSRVEDTRYTCPECSGHIRREERDGIVSFLCEVGHAYSPDSMDGEQALAVEAALWTATRLLGDRATLLGEMAVRASSNGHDRTALNFHERAEEARRAAEAVRSMLVSGAVPTGGRSGRAAA